MLVSFLKVKETSFISYFWSTNFKVYDFLGSNFKLKDPLLSVVNFEVELSVINSKLILEGANLLPIFTGISFSTNSTVGFSG